MKFKNKAKIAILSLRLQYGDNHHEKPKAPNKEADIYALHYIFLEPYWMIGICSPFTKSALFFRNKHHLGTPGNLF